MPSSLRTSIEFGVKKVGDFLVFDKVRGDVKNLQKETARTKKELDNLSKRAVATNRSMLSMASSVRTNALALAAASASMLYFAASVIEAGNAIEGLKASLTATFGLANVATEIEFLKDAANELGVEYLSLAQSYGKWAAAAEKSSLAGQQQRDIFLSMTKAGRVLNLTTDEMHGALNALQQMISKGKVSAEELRGQLGERLPGAFQLAAKAMGVTTAELDKMLVDGKLMAEDLLPRLAIELDNTFGGDALNAAMNNLAANTNRVKNEFFEFKEISFELIKDDLNDLAQVTASVMQDVNESLRDGYAFDVLESELSVWSDLFSDEMDFISGYAEVAGTATMWTFQQLFNDLKEGFLNLPAGANSAFTAIHEYGVQAAIAITHENRILDLEMGKIWIHIVDGFQWAMGQIRIASSNAANFILKKFRGINQTVKTALRNAIPLGLDESLIEFVNKSEEAQKKLTSSLEYNNSVLAANDAAIAKLEDSYKKAEDASNARIKSARDESEAAVNLRHENVAMVKEMHAAEQQIREMEKAHTAAARAAESLANKQNLGTVAAKSSKTAQDKLAKAAKKVTDAFKSQMQSFDEQIIKLTQGEEAAYRYRKQLDGFNKTQIEQLNTKRKHILALKEEEKAAKEVEKAQESLIKAQQDEIESLNDAYNKLNITSEAYYAASLNSKKFEASVVAEAQALNYRNNLLKEQQSLDSDLIGNSGNKAEIYRKELEKAGFVLADINNLVSRQMQIVYDGLLKKAEQHTQEILLSEQAYRELALIAEGYTEEQAKHIAGVESYNRKLEDSQELAKDLERSLTDAFMGAITEGKNLFDSFKDFLKETFNKLVLKPVISAFTAPISNSISSMLGGGGGGISGLLGGGAGTPGIMSSAGGGGGGLSSITSLFSGNQIGGLFSQAGGFLGTDIFSGAAGMSNGAFGAAGLLGGLFGDKAFGGKGGIGGSLGATIGMAVGGPIGAALGALGGSLIGSLFGRKKDYKDGGIELDYNFGEGASGQSYRDWEKKGGWFRSTKRGTDYEDLDDDFNSGISDYFSQLETVIEKQADYFDIATTAFDYSANSGKISTKDKTEEEIAALVNEWSASVKEELYGQTFDGVFDDLRLENEDLANTLDRLIIETETVTSFTDRLGLSFNIAGINAAIAADNMAQAAGGIANLTGQVDFYYQNFYSEQERLIDLQQDATAVLNSFNEEQKTLIATESDLRRYIEGLDLTTEAGQKAFAAAMQLAPALVSLTDVQNELTKREQERLSAEQQIIDEQKAAAEALREAFIRENQLLIDSMLNQSNTLKAAIENIVDGDLSILTPVQKMEDARGDFDTLYVDALSGDDDAIDALASAGQSLLQLSQAYNASSADYISDYESVMAALSAVAQNIDNAMAPKQIEITEQINGTHAEGLVNVPFDGYRAELHKGEAIIDARTMFGMRKYGLSASTHTNNDNSELVKELQAVKAELMTIRQQQQSIAISASHQRDDSNQQKTKIHAELKAQQKSKRIDDRMKRVI